MTRRDDGRADEWRETILRICKRHRCVFDEVEFRIVLTDHGSPRYHLYIKGVKISDSNSIDMMTDRLSDPE